ncbi:MAG: type II toxin-antitoxin system RelE/ParE family toxin [Desulfobulbaceae bacterium]|nr:type II toxin-antitoxin system RelE/ParE family toxin [Desulfobulbaceae bacterium]
MPRFTLTSKAKSDLIEIARYTQERWGREQRNLCLRMLDECFRQLAGKPQQGSDCSEIRAGYRKLLVGRHIIFYRQPTGDSIEIVRILHGRMDVETHLAGV